jgi:hypothetical protein
MLSGLAGAQSAPAPKNPPPDAARHPASDTKVAQNDIKTAQNDAKPAQSEASPATAVAATKAPDIEARLSEQEKRTADLEARLSAAEEAVAQAESKAEENKIRLYGFSEFGFRKAWIDDRSFFNNITEDKSTFLLGSTNVYFDAQPHPAIRSLTEVRFTLYPNGVPGTDFRPTQSATVYDLTSASGRNKVQWSGIVLERSVLEWKHSDAFRVMAGYFLTPYGIWNVDHGSPTLISSSLPNFFALEYFPTRLTGIQFLGSVTTGDWELGYRAYITNGRNRVLFDNQNDKLIGGRLYATARSNWGAFTIGTSGFRGSFIEKTYKINFEQSNPEATFRVTADPFIEYQEWGAAADMALDAGPLRMRSEFVFNRTDYTNNLRASTPSGTSFYADRSRWNAYYLVAYRLPWLGLEPYFYGEFDRRPDTVADRSIVVSGGLNIILTPSAKIKAQYFRSMFLGTHQDTRVNDFDLLDVRFVVAY